MGQVYCPRIEIEGDNHHTVQPRYTASLLFSTIQIILLSLIGVFIFGANLYINFPSLILVFLMGALSFNALGYFISSFSKTTEAMETCVHVLFACTTYDVIYLIFVTCSKRITEMLFLIIKNCTSNCV